MRISKKSEKAALSIVLVAAMLISMIACTIVVRAEATEDIADTGADNYYLWGLNTNDPDFGSLHSPTGSFSYDGTKGYYYYDLTGASGDYCFVVSKVSDSGTAAVKSPAVGGVQNAGKYYLSQGNYHGYVCMHIWNQSGDAVRIYFTSENAGLNCIPQSEAGSVTPDPTSPQNPTSSIPVSSGYIYCKNSVGWSSVYAYLWTTGPSDQNAAWPGAQMENVGGNLWRCAVNGSYANIVFNGGGDATKTDDMAFPGVGKVYDNHQGTWGDYTPIDPTTSGYTNPPSTNPPSTNPPATSSQNPTSSSGGDKIVYCKNEAGWSTVTAYMWNSGTDANAGWPGAKMTLIGGDIWQYNIPKDFKNIIFSQNGQNQTSDLVFPGNGYIYNNKTGKWEIYDTSPLQVTAFGTDVEAPQYAGIGITLSASAKGQGTVYYKFSVGSTVLKDFSTKNSALWTPTSAGDYTLTYEFKDSKGNTNKRTKTYQITDGSTSSNPFIKTVSPANGQQIKKSSACNISVSAGGGNTGTKLLFYKYTVKDASGNTVNVPYYTKKANYSFTPSTLGRYVVTVSVQGSDNAIVERDYIYESVTNPSGDSDETAPFIPPATQVTPPTTTPGDYLIGDADMDGSVTILDATRIQRWLAELVTDNEIHKKNADADLDGFITILDATHIQRFIAGLVEKLG